MKQVRMFARIGSRQTPPASFATGWKPGPMPPPYVIILEAEASGGVLALGYAADGSFSGDTWHETLEYGKTAAGKWAGVAGLEWRDIPPDIVDVRDWCILNA